MGKKNNTKTSLELLVHHGRPCPYCETTMRTFGKGVWTGKRKSNHPTWPTRDHLIPKSVMPGMGVIVVCRKCNQDKNNKSLRAWSEQLKANGDSRYQTVKKFMKNNNSYELEGK